MTDTELSEINAALERAGGDRAAAAVALRIPVGELNNRVHNCPALWTRWATGGERKILPPDVAESVSRDMLELQEVTGGELVTPKMAAAVEMEDRKLEKGLGALKMSDKAMELAKSFHAFQSKNFSRSATIVAGGLIRRYCENEVKIDALWVEVEKSRLCGDSSDDNDESLASYGVPREQYLLNSIAQLTAIQQKAYKLIVDAGLTSAIIAQKVAALNGGDGNMKKAGKPGFGPKQRKQPVDVESKAVTV